jgi:hypothetical protein
MDDAEVRALARSAVSQTITALVAHDGPLLMAVMDDLDRALDEEEANAVLKAMPLWYSELICYLLAGISGITGVPSAEIWRVTAVKLAEGTPLMQ